jgi:hypothetical protein
MQCASRFVAQGVLCCVPIWPCSLALVWVFTPDYVTLNTYNGARIEGQLQLIVLRNSLRPHVSLVDGCRYEPVMTTDQSPCRGIKASGASGGLAGGDAGAHRSTSSAAQVVDTEIRSSSLPCSRLGHAYVVSVTLCDAVLAPAAGLPAQFTDDPSAARYGMAEVYCNTHLDKCRSFRGRRVIVDIRCSQGRHCAACGKRKGVLHTWYFQGI